MVGCTIGDAKCTKLGTLLLYAVGANFGGVKPVRGVSASCIVIALSACWLINLALDHVPPPSIWYGGMIITGDVVVRTLVDRHFTVVGPVSGRINAGATR